MQTKIFTIIYYEILEMNWNSMQVQYIPENTFYFVGHQIIQHFISKIYQQVFLKYLFIKPIAEDIVNSFGSIGYYRVFLFDNTNTEDAVA